MSQTTSKPGCKEVIETCDKALDAKNKALQLSDLAIKECQKHVGDLTVEVNELRDSNTSILKNPIVWFLLGSAATATAYVFLKK